jgi:polysaccharide pyruvyl transferase WcaK-like protein
MSLPSNKPVWIGLLGASFDTGNYGVSALAEGAIRALLEKWPNANFILLASGRSVRKEVRTIGPRTLEMVNLPVRFCRQIFLKNHYWVLLLEGILWRLLKSRRYRVWTERRNPYIEQISRLDLVADLTGGDSFSDLYGWRRFLQGALTKGLWLLYGKPLYFLPQTYGPFRRRWVRATAKLLLKRASVLCCRDRQGETFLRRLFADCPAQQEKIRVIPDVGFLLEPRPVEDSLAESIRQWKRQGKPAAGLNVSGLLYSGGYTRRNMFGLCEDYPSLICEIASLLVKEGCLVLLVPHVFPPSKVYQAEDDLEACRQVCRRVREEIHLGQLHVAEGPYSPNEMKFIIGQCDFFAGSRMHSCIAALSQQIPTVGLAYSDKFTGVFELAGQQDCVIDIRRIKKEDVLYRLNILYKKRREIQCRLETEVPLLKNTIFRGFRELPELKA